MSAERTEPGESSQPTASEGNEQSKTVVPRFWNVWQTIGLTLLSLAGGIVASLVFRALISASGLDLEGGVLPIAECSSSVAIIVLTIWFARIRCDASVSRCLALRPVGFKTLVSSLFVMCVIGLVFGFLGGSPNQSDISDFLQGADKSASFLVLFGLGVVFISPLAEELLFRGFMFHGLRNSTLGGVGATVITAALWAILHFQYDALVVFSLFGFGLLLGASRDITGSIVPSLLMHMAANFVRFVQFVLM